MREALDGRHRLSRPEVLHVRAVVDAVISGGSPSRSRLFQRARDALLAEALRGRPTEPTDLALAADLLQESVAALRSDIQGLPATTLFPPPEALAAEQVRRRIEVAAHVARCPDVIHAQLGEVVAAVRQDSVLDLVDSTLRALLASRLLAEDIDHQRATASVGAVDRARSTTERRPGARRRTSTPRHDDAALARAQERLRDEVVPYVNDVKSKRSLFRNPKHASGPVRSAMEAVDAALLHLRELPLAFREATALGLPLQTYTHLGDQLATVIAARRWGAMPPSLSERSDARLPVAITTAHGPRGPGPASAVRRAMDYLRPEPKLPRGKAFGL